MDGERADHWFPKCISITGYQGVNTLAWCAESIATHFSRLCAPFSGVGCAAGRHVGGLRRAVVEAVRGPGHARVLVRVEDVELLVPVAVHLSASYRSLFCLMSGEEKDPGELRENSAR